MAKEKNALKKGAKSKNGNGGSGREKKLKFDLHPETKKSVWAVVFIGIAIILFLASFRSAGPFGN